MELLQANPYLTLVEVATEMGKSKSAVELASAKLVKDGLIKYVGPQKGGHRETL